MLLPVALYVAILSLLLLAVGPLVAFLELVPPVIGLALFAAGSLAGLVALVAGLVAVVRGRRRYGLVAAAVGAPALLIGVAFVASGARHPRLNDVTSDVSDPPELATQEPYPSDFAPVASAAYGDVQTLTLAMPAETAFARAVSVARKQPGWTVERVDDDAHRLWGVAVSPLFKFRDDFVIRVRAAADGTALVDMRSRSRAGKSDFGANAARIRQFFAALASGT